MRVKVGKHAWQGVFEQAVEVHIENAKAPAMTGEHTQ